MSVLLSSAAMAQAKIPRFWDGLLDHLAAGASEERAELVKRERLRSVSEYEREFQRYAALYDGDELRITIGLELVRKWCAIIRRTIESGNGFAVGVEIRKLKRTVEIVRPALAVATERGVKVMYGARRSHGDPAELRKRHAQLQSMLDGEIARNPRQSFTAASEKVAKFSTQSGQKITGRSVRTHTKDPRKK